MKVFNTFHMKFLLGNKYNSDIQTVWNAKVTSTSIDYKKTELISKLNKLINHNNKH